MLAVQFSATSAPGMTLSGDMLATKANLKGMGFTDLDDAFGTSDGTIKFKIVEFANAASHDQVAIEIKHSIDVCRQQVRKQKSGVCGTGEPRAARR